MAEIDDLKTSVQNMTGAVTKTGTALDDLAAKLAALAGQPTINPADVAAAAQQIQTLADSLNASVAKDDPPAPTT